MRINAYQNTKLMITLRLFDGEIDSSLLFLQKRIIGIAKAK